MLLLRFRNRHTTTRIVHDRPIIPVPSWPLVWRHRESAPAWPPFFVLINDFLKRPSHVVLATMTPLSCCIRFPPMRHRILNVLAMLLATNLTRLEADFGALMCEVALASQVKTFATQVRTIIQGSQHKFPPKISRPRLDLFRNAPQAQLRQTPIPQSALCGTLRSGTSRLSRRSGVRPQIQFRAPSIRGPSPLPPSASGSPRPSRGGALWPDHLTWPFLERPDLAVFRMGNVKLDPGERPPSSA